MDIPKYVDDLTEKALATEPTNHTTGAVEPMESVLKGRAIELWCTPAGQFFLVADEADASRLIDGLGTRRGEIYTAEEARRVIAVNDPAVVAEIHDWKRRFDAKVREFRCEDRHR